ncbi:MAG TPA: GNAT family N-acetyltransferase [Blastocatellia bacterium]|nr:GNAT family N-acetyltransferase [Blastocatellia bacterium]
MTGKVTTQTKLEIRDYNKSDFQRLYDIDQAAFPKGIAYSHLELHHYIRARKSRTLVAADAGVVIGFVIACSEPRQLGHIITIDVVPHRQREQIGSQLLDHIERWLWQQGAQAIYLETPVDDAGAQGFYDKHGYFVLDRIEAYYNESIDALVMMKTSKGRSR